MWGRSGARAQAYVEYGLLVAVAVIAFLVGMNVLMGAATTYLAHAEPTPNATALAGLPNHVVSMNLVCSPPPPPLYTGTPFNCSITVTDITTIEPGRLPTGKVAFSSSVGGTFNPGPCTLSGSGVTSGCTFQYTATNFGQQDITATYIPSSSHQSRTIPSPPVPGQLVATAVDQTDTRVACAPSVAVGEPSQCNAEVWDLYPARFGTLPNLNVDVATVGSGTFSDTGALTPRSNGAYACVTDRTLTDGTVACSTLFRSDAVPAEVGKQHTIVAAFAGTQDYDASDTSKAPPQVVNITNATHHPVTVLVQCDAGQQPTSPMQMNATPSTTCTAIVTDTNPPSTGNPTSVSNPTSITPSGTISWTSSADSGGAGTVSSNACTLSKVTEASAQCTTTYTPTSVGTPAAPNYEGTHTIRVAYSADWIHPDLGDLSGSTSVFVKDAHPVLVTVACAAPGSTRASPLLIQGASADTTQCTVTVADTSTSGTPQTPTGTVSWGLSANGGTGAFVPSAPCQLQPINNSSAWCQPAVTYQPSVRGTPDGLPDQESTHTLVPTYVGDWLHPALPNDVVQSANVFVANFHAVQVVVACVPPTSRAQPLVVGPPPTSTACTVNVVDTDATPVTPTGSVTWSMMSAGANGDGTFSPNAPCQLQAVNASKATCQQPVTYQPTARGALDRPGIDMDNTHQITATYSGDGLHPPYNNDELGTTIVSVSN